MKSISGLAPAFAHRSAQIYPAIADRIGGKVVLPKRSKVSDQPFYIVNRSEVASQYKLWTESLPRVTPFYAVKCNPDIELLKTLFDLGAKFDCASSAEINSCLNAGAGPEDIIYANPCKMVSQIQHAQDAGVRLMTFDNEMELIKIKETAPNSRLVIRILVDDSSSICRLSTKFGAYSETIPKLVYKAKELGLDICGISFHVGSGCMDATAYASAVHEARKAFDLGLAAGHKMELLDIGGGFPGHSRPLATESGVMAPTFSEIVRHLHPALEKHFPGSAGVKIIAEPGRFFATSSHTLLVNVFSRRDPTESSSSSYMYYVNDGLYGSFNCMLYDHATVEPEILSELNDGQIVSFTSEEMELANALKRNIEAAVPAPASSTPMSKWDPISRLKVQNAQLFSTVAAAGRQQMYESSIWGPTCDGLDCIAKKKRLPKLELGQWLMFRDMGAYTAAAGSQFNGFELPDRIYI